MMFPAVLQKQDRVSSKVSDKFDEINSMPTGDQRKHRKHPRVPTSNLISLNLYDEEGRLLNHSMAKALNVSQGGIQIETAIMIKSDRISLMSADTENKLVEVKGRVRYSRENEYGMFETGISFEGTDDEKIEFAKKLVMVFHRRKKGLLEAVNQ